MVWQAVPQNSGEFVYSHVYTPADSMNSVIPPRTTKGSNRTKMGELDEGRKKSRNLDVKRFNIDRLRSDF